MRRWKRCGLEHELRGMATRQRLHLTATSCRLPRSLGRYLRHQRRRVIACRAPARQVRVGGRERRDMDQRLQRAVGERVLSLSEYGEQAQNVWRTRTRVGWPCLPRTPCSNSASIRGRVHTRARTSAPSSPSRWLPPARRSTTALRAAGGHPRSGPARQVCRTALQVPLLLPDARETAMRAVGLGRPLAGHRGRARAERDEHNRPAPRGSRADRCSASGYAAVSGSGAGGGSAVHARRAGSLQRGQQP